MFYYENAFAVTTLTSRSKRIGALRERDGILGFLQMHCAHRRSHYLADMACTTIDTDQFNLVILCSNAATMRNGSVIMIAMISLLFLILVLTLANSSL